MTLCTTCTVILQILILFILPCYLGGTLSKVLGSLGLSRADRWVTDTRAFEVFLLPIVYWTDAKLFSGRHWHVPRRTWLAIAVVALVRLWLLAIRPAMSDTNPDWEAMLGALVFPPLVEEFVRAALIRLLLGRLGTWTAVVLTSMLVALCHAGFGMAFAQAILIGAIFLYTDQSLPAAMMVHFVMNAIAVYASF
jgi:membrane protease YdiL (CAAX protease family)